MSFAFAEPMLLAVHHLSQRTPSPTNPLFLTGLSGFIPSCTEVESDLSDAGLPTAMK
jgi:hypothetical protein